MVVQFVQTEKKGEKQGKKDHWKELQTLQKHRAT